MIPAAVATFVFLCGGLLALFWPRHVQQFAVRLYEKIGFGPFTVLAQRMRRDFYIIQLRTIGFVCLPAGLIMGGTDTVMRRPKSNQTIEPTASRRTIRLHMSSPPYPAATRALARSRLRPATNVGLLSY